MLTERIIGESLDKSRALEIIRKNNPFRHPELAIVSLGGSSSSNSGGERSDIDITTVMKPENPAKIDINSIITLASQLREFTFSLQHPRWLNSELQVVVIATIRLEEAQVALARATSLQSTILPIHWLHYPSVEFAKINEPPELFEGLLDGETLSGTTEKVTEDFKKAKTGDLTHLGGLDWLTDSFRVFLANMDPNEKKFGNNANLPSYFLKNLSLHNLEYFWKWKIVAKIIEQNTARRPRNWKEMEELKNVVPHGLWQLSMRIRGVRHEGDNALGQEIVDLHKQTFDLWPISI